MRSSSKLRDLRKKSTPCMPRHLRSECAHGVGGAVAARRRRGACEVVERVSSPSAASGSWHVDLQSCVGEHMAGLQEHSSSVGGHLRPRFVPCRPAPPSDVRIGEAMERNHSEATDNLGA